MLYAICYMLYAICYMLYAISRLTRESKLTATRVGSLPTVTLKISTCGLTVPPDLGGENKIVARHVLLDKSRVGKA
jgi:hypothetical protein